MMPVMHGAFGIACFTKFQLFNTKQFTQFQQLLANSKFLVVHPQGMQKAGLTMAELSKQPEVKTSVVHAE
jgi:hypothetical protein